MNIAIALVLAAILAAGTLALAASHNTPFDAITRRGRRRPTR
jgi:hypothetical protein